MDDTGADQTILHNKPARAKKKWFVLMVVVIVIAALTTLVIIKKKGSNPFPKDIRTSANFPLYYPDNLPDGYELSRTSIKYENGVVFYSLSNDGKTISISEQSTPSTPPDFSAIQKAYSSFKKLDIPAGQAISGDYQGTPTAIMLTNTTLININASKDNPEDVLVKLIQGLRSLPN